MKKKTCTCRPETLNPAEDFFARGQIHFFMALNLSGFIDQACREDFERLRGGQAFGTAFKELRPGNGFVEDEEERQTVSKGYEFQVFRGHIRNNWLFTTFRLDPEQVPPPDDPVLAKEWAQSVFHIRLSRTGFLEIKLTRSIPAGTQDGQQKTIDILHDLLELGSRGGTNGSSRSTQIKLAMHCADLFLKALPKEIEIKELEDDGDGYRKVPIRLTPLGPEPESLPLREYYTILFLNEISCQKCGRRISAQTFWSRDRKTLAAILEGTLIGSANGKHNFPTLGDENTRFKDLSTWEDELCVFAPERCLIYYPPENIFLPGQAQAKPVNYADYWKCIIRGIEHTICVSAALQVIEWHTTRDLDEVPRLTKKVTDGEISDTDVEQILYLAQEISNTFNMLPVLRDVLVTTSSFRASYAVDKFDHLNIVLHLKDIQQHIQRNVDELVIFLNHFSSMRMQETSVQLQKELLSLQKEIAELDDRVKSSESNLNRIGAIIAVIALLVAGPSFLQDFQSFFVEKYGLHEFTAWLCFTPIVILAIALIFYIRDPSGVLKLFKPRSNKKR
jgi:hypothetical protein